jgi:hypothetical protein
MSLQGIFRVRRWGSRDYNVSPAGARNLARRLILRARSEAALALGPLAHLPDRARHPEVRYLEMDVARLNALFPPARRAETARALSAALMETDRLGYFGNLPGFQSRHRRLPRGLPPVADLHPPNLAVLDFLAHRIAAPEREVLLDFACGIPALLVYARELGFTRIRGFDDWSWLARSTAERFLDQAGLDAASVLVERQDLAAIPATIVTCVGFRLRLLMVTSNIWAQPSVKYVLADRIGRPDALPGFRRTGEYAGLLTIFERTQESCTDFTA